MPMGTPSAPDENDTGHTPGGPAVSYDLSPGELAQKRAALKAQLAALGPETTDPVSAPTPQDAEPLPPQPAAPFAAVNMLGGDQPPPAVAPAPVSAPAPAVSRETPQDTAPVDAAPAAAGDGRTIDITQGGGFSHWLHLADGRIIKALGTFTRWHDTDDPRDPGVPVVASVQNPSFVEGSGDIDQRRRSLLAELKALGFDLSDLVGLLK